MLANKNVFFCLLQQWCQFGSKRQCIIFTTKIQVQLLHRFNVDEVDATPVSD